jgi:glutamate racemase
MINDPRPIGMFDSGLGGLTVAKEFFSGMPGENIIYLGDTARNPYGGRSEETIKSFGLQDAGFLLSMDIKMLVVACNTVSSVALEAIRNKFNDIPVIGVVVPGARAAVSHTAVKRVGVIGTKATIRTHSYEKAIAMVDPEIKTYSRACPLFVPLVEEGLIDNDITRMAAQHYLYDLVNYGIDCLILGCTHYPMLMESIQGVMGAGVQLLDSAFWTAKEAKDILTAMDIRNAATSGGMEKSRFFVTDLTDGFREISASFLGGNTPNAEKINLEQLTKYTI